MRTRLESLQVLTAFGARLFAATLLSPAIARMQSKIARLSEEMGLRSAEVIVFPQSRRRHPSPLLKLSQRTESTGRQPKPSRNNRAARMDRG